MQARRRQRNFFDDPFLFGTGQMVPRALQAPAVQVQINPLPPYSGAARFSGLIGRFDIRSEIDTRQMTVGASATWTLTIAGYGNIKDAPPPEVTFPDAFKVYPDTPESRIQPGASGPEGEKVFRMAIVPLRPGRHVLPTVSLVFFDPQSGTYVTRTTDSLEIKADADPNAPTPSVPALQKPGEQTGKTQVTFTGHDILPLKENIRALSDQAPMGPARFLILLALPPCIYAILLWMVHRRRKGAHPSRILAEKGRAALKAARSADSDESCLTFLHRALVAAVRSRSGAMGESLTADEAQEILTASGAPSQVLTQVLEQLARIESARYGGGALKPDEKDALIAAVGGLMEALIR